jgi:hypothetical protein
MINQLKVKNISSSKKGKLTLKNIYSNVTCWRYLVCRRRNKTLQFYNEVKSVMSKCLSAEYLLYTLIELQRLKCLSCPGIGGKMPIDTTSRGENAKKGYMFEQEEVQSEYNINSINESFGTKLDNIK